MPVINVGHNRTDNAKIVVLFPTPVYTIKRDSDLDSSEEKDIEDIIEGGIHQDGTLDHHSDNTYIFDTKLKNLKEFCEQHIENYVKQIINPKQKIDFYITQSWLNVVEPGGSICRHWHSNSIISGTFYPKVEETDTIEFHDPNKMLKERICMIERIESNHWNSSSLFFLVEKNNLMLFPSWLEHNVRPNEKATTNRISISFNVFVKGILGKTAVVGLNELILK